ncbi:MAG: FAD-dependent oxidoreductase [Burkholderiales bacterium]
MSTQDVEIAVVGAGVIGLATTLRLRDDGRDVVLIDPNGPGSGASFGNAGTIAGYGCVPVATPQVMWSLPRLLLDPDSPLSMPASAVSAMLPWLWRFVRASSTSAATASARALAPLLAQAAPAWERRWAALDCEDIVRREGCLYLYQAPPSIDAFDFRLRAEHGVKQEPLSPAEVGRLEPALAPLGRHGVFFPDAMHLASPATLMQRMAAAAERRGARQLRARAVRLQADPTGITLELELEGNGDGEVQRVRAGQVVIAAGAHSLDLARQAGEDVPLDTERGYHVEYAVDPLPVRRPVCPVEREVYATPMAGRLRVAGLVEFGGTARAANPQRWAQLDRGARALFGSLPEPTSRWVGFRPSMPDGAGHRPRSRRTGCDACFRPRTPRADAGRRHRRPGRR